MEDFYDRLALLKTRKKLTNTDLGKIIGKKGEAFRMSVVRKSLSELEKSKLSELFENTQNQTILEPEQVYFFENKNGNQFYEKASGSIYVKVPLLPFEAFASYAETLEVGKPIKDLEIEEFAVDQYGKGNYMAFKVRGDSMNGGSIEDTPDGAKVLARELGRQHWKDGFNDTEYGWIILCKENIFHKDIVAYDAETGDITLHSRNKSPEYSDFTINLNDCYQIFKVIKRTF